MFKMMREVQPEQSTNNTDVKSQIEALGARMYVLVFKIALWKNITHSYTKQPYRYDTKRNQQLDWNSLAGYESLKQDIQDTLILPLKHPETFDGVAKRT